ncbi:hypothetical protein KIN20_014203 [Parelaphostrongylus tenuis]|uniref:Uncharacterized protein n=1 Tax=Parelaphostrongylus tenuis TaxID=148309 RepID=A0AAD5QLH7_PARTN|nr:hypothetical protein KIN20_014203 [Parelaphostrongylus tenuis]
MDRDGSHKQRQFKIEYTQRITAYPHHGVLRRRSLTNVKLILNGKCVAHTTRSPRLTRNQVSTYPRSTFWNDCLDSCTSDV